MTDQELIERFENGTIPNECFHHREHVRAAFLYLTEHPVLEALQVFSKSLRKFAEAHGKPQLYNETITWAFVFLIHERMARAGRKQGWEEFARDNSDLLVWKDGVLTRYYRAETLKSALARAVFVFPDLFPDLRTSSMSPTHPESRSGMTKTVNRLIPSVKDGVKAGRP